MLFECTHCNEMNEENRRFCFHCGELLGCPICGFINEYIVETEQRNKFFCGGCGSTLSFENSVLEEKAPQQDLLTEPAIKAPKTEQYFKSQSELAPNSILGFSLTEIEADMMAESLVGDSEEISLGAPKHLAQSDLDELFDV